MKERSKYVHNTTYCIQNIMIYVMSDIHGCYDKYHQMIEKLKLTADDALFVLGDVIDYGDDGIRILKDMMYRANVYPVLGEHEYIAKQVFPLIEQAKSLEECAEYVHGEDAVTLGNWLKNGGGATIKAFLALNAEDRESIIDYLDEFEPFEEVEAAGRSFVLVHAGIEDFEEDKPLEDYDEKAFISAAADYSKIYFSDKYLVTGHTPTLSIMPSNNGKVYSKKRHLAIDCGAFYGGRLAAVCLDTLKAFYC